MLVGCGQQTDLEFPLFRIEVPTAVIIANHALLPTIHDQHAYRIHAASFLVNCTGGNFPSTEAVPPSVGLILILVFVLVRKYSKPFGHHLEVVEDVIGVASVPISIRFFVSPGLLYNVRHREPHVRG